MDRDILLELNNYTLKYYCHIEDYDDPSKTIFYFQLQEKNYSRKHCICDFELSFIAKYDMPGIESGSDIYTYWLDEVSASHIDPDSMEPIHQEEIPNKMYWMKGYKVENFEHKDNKISIEEVSEINCKMIEFAKAQIKKDKESALTSC